MHNEVVRKLKRLEHVASIFHWSDKVLRTFVLKIHLKVAFTFDELFKV